MIKYTVPVPLPSNDSSLGGSSEEYPHELFTRSIENLLHELQRWEEEAELGKLHNCIALDLCVKKATAAHQGDANSTDLQLRLTRDTLPRLSYIVERFSFLPDRWTGGTSWHVGVAPASVMHIAEKLGNGMRELSCGTAEMGFSAEDIRARSGMYLPNINQAPCSAIIC